MIYDWQELDGSISGGIKKGELKFVVLKCRGIGKSMFTQIIFSSSWTKWEKIWSWKPKVSSESGKLLWGNIMIRENKFTLHRYGRKIIKYASPKEALKQQREEFKGILKRG